MFEFITLLEIYFLVLLFVTIYPSVFNNLGMVLVLHRRLLSWVGSRVFPLSRPLHYPAVTCKSAATLGPHCGAFIRRL
jgi:hypothetical protein